MPRPTISKLERGDRRTVPVQEIAVLARALGVPPVRLMFDLRAGDVPAKVLPGIQVLPVEGVEWFSGRARIDGEGSVAALRNDGNDDGLSDARTERESRIWAVLLVDELVRLRRELADAELGILPPSFPTADRLDHLDLESGPSDAEFVAEQRRLSIRQRESELYTALGKMRQARAGMWAAGMAVPGLPESLVAPLEPMGGDVARGQALQRDA